MDTDEDLYAPVRQSLRQVINLGIFGTAVMVLAIAVLAWQRNGSALVAPIVSASVMIGTMVVSAYRLGTLDGRKR